MTAPQTTHDEITRLRAAHSPRNGMWFNIIVTVIEIGGTLVLFRLARGAGASEVAAYLIGSIAPVVGALAVWIRSRRLSGASAAIFAFTILSAAVAVIGSTEPKVLLYKDCAVTAVIGLIFAGSCLLARPVVFYFAQRYGTDGTDDGMRTFDLMWEAYPTFRRGMYGISMVWAGVFLVQAAVTAVIIAGTTFDTGYTWDQVLPFVAFGVAFVLTVALARRMRAAGEIAGARIAAG